VAPVTIIAKINTKKVMAKLAKDIEAVFAKWPKLIKKKIANNNKNKQ